MASDHTKKEFADFICRPHCVFFKEGKKEDMACGGALALLDLIDEGLLSIEDLAVSGGRDDTAADDGLLYERICRRCPFVLDGCDFRLPTPPGDAVACGGYLLLRALFHSGTLTARMIGDDHS